MNITWWLTVIMIVELSDWIKKIKDFSQSSGEHLINVWAIHSPLKTWIFMLSVWESDFTQSSNAETSY